MPRNYADDNVDRLGPLLPKRSTTLMPNEQLITCHYMRML